MVYQPDAFDKQAKVEVTNCKFEDQQNIQSLGFAPPVPDKVDMNYYASLLYSNTNMPNY